MAISPLLAIRTLMVALMVEEAQVREKKERNVHRNRQISQDDDMISQCELRERFVSEL
jgi:hypothetical protein